MKKVINFLIVTILAISFVDVVNAKAFIIYNKECLKYYSNEEIQYILKESDPIDLDLTCKNGTIYNEEKIDNDKNLNNDIIQTKYFTNELNVQYFKQDKSYYCGYAATKEVLHYINGKSKSQTQYAKDMGTQGSSAVVYKIKNLLNKNITGAKYTYTLGKNYNLDSFKQMVIDSINKKRPVIMHAKANYLQLYKGAKKSIWHYYVISGYSVSYLQNGEVMMYVDSYSNNYGAGNTFGRHTDSAQNIFNTVNINGRYIIHA